LAPLSTGRQLETLRRALRQGELTADHARPDLQQWIDLFRRSPEPGFQVLVLELLAPLPDPAVAELAEDALTARGDGVRLAGLRLLLEHSPDRLADLDPRLRDDDNLEIRLLLAERMYATRPAAAVDRVFEILEEEALGPRELHALERGIEFLVDETNPAGLRPRLEALRDSVRDPEGFLDWGLDRLQRRTEGNS
ncbi:MAG: hypothetical protein HKO53_07410, partial [Gemmatimonadetes bacterium]|nr:hypothetical protein [Gemmatimonadota bacterium]